jgi:tetratricopeptide (TPR) repeat protein
MRGIDDYEAFDKFVVAVSGFPPTARKGMSAEDVFKHSVSLLHELASGQATFPRAMGWKAYALALSVYESWELPDDLPEYEMSPAKRLDEALKLAEEAATEDQFDFDVHWALADVHLIRGGFFYERNEDKKGKLEFAEVKCEFDMALYLNGDERHPNLFAEAASAMMQIGAYDEADKYFRKAERRPDWHHWMRGIDLFLRAGRSGADNRGTLLDAALDELRSASRQPDEEFYQEELQLIMAAVYLRKSELSETKLSATKKKDARKRLELSVQNNRKAAEDKIRHFRERRDWSKKDAKRSLALNPTDRGYWHETVERLWDMSGGDIGVDGKRPPAKGPSGPRGGSRGRKRGQRDGRR